MWMKIPTNHGNTCTVIAVLKVGKLKVWVTATTIERKGRRNFRTSLI